MKKQLTILFVAVLLCVCSLIVLAEDDVRYNLECAEISDDLQVYVTNNASEDVIISPVFASFDADGRLCNSRTWSNVTIPTGKTVSFDVTGRFDETLNNKFFFFDSELSPIREPEELIVKDDDIIFDTDDLFKDDAPRGRTYGDAYTLVETLSANGKNGLTNGWSYDNRFEINNVTGTKKGYFLDDNDETFTALRRELAAVEEEGIIHAEFVVSLFSENGGAYLAFCDENESRIVEITEEDGFFKFCGENSIVSEVAFGEEPVEYVIIVDIDLDNNEASARVNGKPLGTVSMGDNDKLAEIVLGTNDEGTGSVTLTHANVVKNYPVRECFLVNSEGVLSDGCEPDMIYEGVMHYLGLEGDYIKGKYFAVNRFNCKNEITPLKLAELMENKLGIKHIRICGARDVKCTKISACFGTPGGVFEELKDSDVEIVLTGEACEWSLAEYARDAAALGYKKALLIMGHIGSERDGMKYLTKLLKDRFNDLDIKYFDCEEVYSYTD